MDFTKSGCLRPTRLDFKCWKLEEIFQVLVLPKFASFWQMSPAKFQDETLTEKYLLNRKKGVKKARKISLKSNPKLSLLSCLIQFFPASWPLVKKVWPRWDIRRVTFSTNIFYFKKKKVLFCRQIWSFQISIFRFDPNWIYVEIQLTKVRCIGGGGLVCFCKKNLKPANSNQIKFELIVSWSVTNRKKSGFLWRTRDGQTYFKLTNIRWMKLCVNVMARRWFHEKMWIFWVLWQKDQRNYVKNRSHIISFTKRSDSCARKKCSRQEKE